MPLEKTEMWKLLNYHFIFQKVGIRTMKIMKSLQKGYWKVHEILLQNEKSPPPLIFFLLFIYIHLESQWNSPFNVYMLSILPLALMVTLNFNFMFMVASFVKLPSFYLSSIIFLVTLAIGCNEKWKTYIFLFAVGDALAKEHQFKSIYLLLASAFFCLEIYNRFIFRTLKDNRNYFTGFFAITVYGAIHYATKSTNIKINPVISWVMIIVSGFYAYRLFGQKIWKLSHKNVNHIKDSRIMAFYLHKIEEEVRSDYVKESKVSMHRRQCSNLHCFCHYKDKIHKSDYYLRQLYENSIKVFPQIGDPLLYEFYVDFLLKNEMVLKALYFLNQWNDTSYYSFVTKLKCIGKINAMLIDLNSSNIYEKEFKYALKYDNLLLKLTMQIYEVVEIKLVFWHEAAKETPLMIKLQEEGLRIVDKMYELNIFYSEIIKKYERKLYSFDATILYAMYLLSTTNFKEYAELIIKNTSKMLEQVQILENNTSETYAIRTVIKREGLYYIKDRTEELQCISASSKKEKQAIRMPVFKLIIDNASNSFCKLVKINKEHLLGQELNQLIPDGYKHVHREQLLKILNFQTQELGEVISSKILHKASKLPMRVGKNQLIMSYISIKIMIDLEQGSAFVSVVKKMNDKTINALINIDGTLTEKEDGFNEEILKHSEFRKYFEIITERWERERVIKEERFNVMMNAMNFCIVISSPLSEHFTSNLELIEIGSLPPLHVEIVNESSVKNKTFHTNNHEKLVKQIKHMENAINHDSESSSSSKNSNAAINILSTFSEKNTVPTYRRIVLGFLFVITCCLIVSLVSFLFANLEWDNTNIIVNNPLNDTMNFMKLQHLSANILLNLWDIQEYQANPTLNKTMIGGYFSSRSSYVKQVDSVFKTKFNQFKSYFYACLRAPSNLLLGELDRRLSTQLTIYNVSVVPSSMTFISQNITFQSLLMNYLTDFNIMSRGIYGNSLLLPVTYSKEVINMQNASNFGSIINKSINASLEINLIIAIVMGVLITLLLIPMFCFFRSRLPMHQKIFDLFASIESEMVIREIKSLTYINNIIKNYGESSQILKTNVLQYQENAIYPKRGGSRKSSVNNEIVLGLEKFDQNSENCHQQAEDKRLKSAERKINPKKTKRKSHITNFGGIQEYIDMKRTLEKRKRAGDLDFTGSQSDPKTRISKRHAILYLMTLGFIIFLMLETYQTRTYASDMIQKKDNLINVINGYTSMELSFFLVKIYLRNGMAGFGGIDPAYGFAYLQSVVQSIPVYDYSNYYGYDTILPNCTYISKNKTVVQQTVCMFNYSYLTLMGEFGAIVKELFETRLTADQNYSNYVRNNQTAVYNQILTNISQKVFYLQSIDNQLESIVYGIAEYVYSDMFNYSLNVYNYKLNIFIGSVCWWVLTFLVGLIIILSLKRQYFKEVYMLTFLNNEMIMNNKRVESFLESINKSSSN